MGVPDMDVSGLSKAHRVYLQSVRLYLPGFVLFTAENNQKMLHGDFQHNLSYYQCSIFAEGQLC